MKNMNKTSFWYKNKKDYTLLLYAMPFIIFIILINYAQIFGWAFAFVEYKPGVSIFSQKFIGLANFKRLLDPGSNFLPAFRNTIVFGVLGILSSPIPVCFALMLSELRSSKFSRIVQTLTSFPNFVSWVLVYAIAFTFFGSEGYVNLILQKLGVIEESLNILGNPDITYAFQVFLGLWKSVGWSAIIYIAAIAGIDGELYNAASIDGANRFQKIVHVTLQGIKPTFFILLILNISGLISAGFEQYFVFFNPLVSDKMDVISTYIYRIGLGGAQYSFATAVGMFQSVVSVFLMLFVNSMAKKATGNAII